MKTPLRLSLYGLGLVAVFGVAFAAAGALVPASVIEERAAATEGAHDAHSSATADEGAAETALPGLSMSQGGYQLSEVDAPGALGEKGQLSFSIRDTEGAALTEYTEEHEKDLHLIVVRTDGSEFRHVHPEIDDAGTWSLPWSWAEPGAYRVFADFTPGDAESGITLTSTINVGGGEFTPVPATEDVREAKTGDYVVTLTGDLPVGGSSTLALEVTQDGEKVTTLEPYLGAFGHLVALRDGDLAYLHVHPEGAEPEPGQLSGPQVDFATEAPTSGRYLLYFDFKVDGEVHTAEFVLNAAGTPGTAGETPSEPATDDGHDDGESGH